MKKFGEQPRKPAVLIIRPGALRPKSTVGQRPATTTTAPLIAPLIKVRRTRGDQVPVVGEAREFSGQSLGLPSQGTENEGNGQRLTLDGLQNLSPDDRETVRQSDEAYVQIRRTPEQWKMVRAGLVVIRDLAMRETGATSVMSKLYRNRFHELLQHRAYSCEKMSDTTRKTLLQCAQLAPGIDEWHASLDEEERLRLNHPERVLRAFRESQGHKPARRQSRQAQHDAELEKVRQEAATAVSSRDALLEKQQQQIKRLTNQVDNAPSADTEPGIQSIVQDVIARCGATERKIRDVIDGLTAYLEQRRS